MINRTVAAIAALLLVASALAVDSQNSSDLMWYHRGPIYQIFPLAFADSDDDGKGDLQGIIQHVSYLKDLGVEGIWLNPIFKSPMKDSGYDCSDYYEVDPTFGNLTDIEELIEVLHDNDIKILLDFVPNHTSDEHQWFLDSINKTNGKDDWYVWMDPSGYDNTTGDPIAPNNWRGAWTYNSVRKQYYYHRFGTYQPDLNYKNGSVIEAMQDVLRFWLRKGVDGFRIDAPFVLWEDFNNTRDGQTDQLENYYIMKLFDDVLDEEEFQNSSLVNMIESMSSKYYTMMFYDRQNFPFNFQLMNSIQETSNVTVYQEAIQYWMENMTDGRWPNWVGGNHDNSRIASRLGEEMVDPMNMLLLLLPGLAFTYYGEELGMSSLDIRDDLQIPLDQSSQREPERTPMQWNSSLNAGFTTSRKPPSFLPVNPNYWKVNVDEQNNASNSHLKVYKSLVQLHKELINSSLEDLEFHVLSTWVFAFERPEHIVVINLNQLSESVNLTTVDGLPETLHVKIPSINAGYNVNDTVTKSTSFDMTPRSGIVFWFKSSEASNNSSGTSTDVSSGSLANRHSLGVLLLALVFFVTENL